MWVPWCRLGGTEGKTRLMDKLTLFGLFAGLVGGDLVAGCLEALVVGKNGKHLAAVGRNVQEAR